MTLYLDKLATEIGELWIVTDDQRLYVIEYHDYGDRMHSYLSDKLGAYEITAQSDPLGITTRLRLYFDGNYEALDTIPVRWLGTEFQQQVWSALRGIPAGETRTYGQIAEQIGNPNGSRAVGHANSLNPIAIVVPCHRVIGADHRLTGYAGGLNRKDWLLKHEGVHTAGDDRTSHLQMRLFD